MAFSSEHPLRRFIGFSGPYRWRIALALVLGLVLGLTQKGLYFASLRDEENRRL